MKSKHLVLWITILLVYIMATHNIIDTDTWWHLRAGQWMLVNRQILTSDPFSYTRYGADWRYPGWLIQIPMAAIFAITGLGGINLISGLLITATFAVLLVTIRGNLFLRAFLIIFVAVVSSVYWSARPHLITFLFTALYLLLLEIGAKRGYTDTRRMLWIFMPILMLVWVNSHGGFIIGFILWGIYFLEVVLIELFRLWQERLSLWQILRNRELHTFLITGLLMGVVVILNPLGFQIFFYPFRTVSIQTLQKQIAEWQSPNFHELNQQPFLWLMIMLILVSALSKKRWLLREIFLVCGFLYLALMAGRNIALFALVAAMPISRLVGDFDLRSISKGISTKINPRLLDSSKEHPKLNLLIVGLVMLGCLYRSYLAYSEKHLLEDLSKFYPVRAVEYLKENQPQGRLFNSYNWGAYLLWELPEYPVFVDGRTDLYSDEILDQWFQVIYARDGWEQVIDRWQIRVILMEKDWSMAKLLQLNGWCQRYIDEIAIVLEKCR